LDSETLIPVERLCVEPFASVICYPQQSKQELTYRLRELQELRVKAVEFSGKKQAFNVPIWGKGCVGLVVAAYRNGEKIALKMRRMDAGRADLLHEAALLEKANAVGVGPKLLAVSKNFLLSQFVEGVHFPEWAEKKRSKVRICKVLLEVLEQCWRLDSIHLDHGELSHAPKHIIIDKKDHSFIVDFETASLSRRPSNVTAVCQFLFVGGVVAKIVAEKTGERGKDAIIKALRLYKNDRTRENFGRVLRACSV
jgi:putative serine/threonine protein kinase